jgi:hypothetical protein
VLFDQRGMGYDRIVHATVDLGAVEFNASDAMIFADGFESNLGRNP